MHGDQTRRTSSVDGHAGSVPVEEIRDSVRENGPIRSGREIGGNGVEVSQQSIIVVDTHRTDVDSGVGSSHIFHRVAAGFERFVHSLEEDTLLGVDRVGLVGTDVEEGGVENAYIFFEEVGLFDIGGTMMTANRVIVSRRVESI